MNWNGSTWTTQTSPTTETLQGVWAVSANSAWAVGQQGVILFWNGASWNVSLNDATYGNFLGVWAAGQGSAWAVSNLGKIAVWNGTAWSLQPSGLSSTLFSVYGTSASNVWAVGASGTVIRFDGSQWLPAQTGIPSASLTHVFCPDANTVWTVAKTGLIYRWSQGTWTQQTSPTSAALSGVWGVAGIETWIIGAAGTLFHALTS